VEHGHAELLHSPENKLVGMLLIVSPMGVIILIILKRYVEKYKQASYKNYRFDLAT
jgi:hypothetical protein